MLLEMNQIRSSTIERVLAAAGLFLGFAGAIVVAKFNPSTSNFFPVCPLHALTGYSCPGCGLTRGFHSLFHGDIFAALLFNLLLPVYFIVIAYLSISLFLVAARGKGLSYNIFSPRAVYVFLMVSLVFGVLRNLPFYPFSLFAV